MERFAEIIRAIIAAIQITVRTVMRPVLIGGRWVVKAVTETVMLPARATAAVLSPLGRLFGPRGASVGAQQAAAADEAGREIRDAKADRDGTDELRAVAKRLQRAALYKSRGHDTAEGIIAELPAALAGWVRKLSLTECKALSELPVAHVVEHLRDRQPTLQGVRTLEEIHDEQPSVSKPAPDRTDAERAVLGKLAERILARGRTARTAGDVEDACTID